MYWKNENKDVLEIYWNVFTIIGWMLIYWVGLKIGCEFLDKNAIFKKKILIYDLDILRIFKNWLIIYYFHMSWIGDSAPRQTNNNNKDD